MTYTVDPALIAAVEATDIPRRDRMKVYAAIRQAREFPKLAWRPTPLACCFALYWETNNDRA